MLKKLLWFHRCTAYYHYRWQIKVGSVATEFGAVAGTAICLYFNILNLNLLLKYFIHVPIFPFALGKVTVVLIIIAIVSLNYFYLAAGGRFERIKKEFENSKGRKWKVITVLYTISSFILFFVLVIATTKR